MDRNEAASVIRKYLTCTDITHSCNGKCKACRYHTNYDEKELALRLAIAALDKDINVPSKSALDHIHNVVAKNERKRGYEQAKAEYDHKLTAIKNTIKDYYYIYGYEKGKADAAPKWIPVSERLPSKYGEYFVSVKWFDGTYDVSVYEYTGYNEWNDGDMCGQTVTAWMPLPEPWEGE